MSQTQGKRKSGQALQMDPFDELSESGKEACQQLLTIYKRANDAVVPSSRRKIGTVIIQGADDLHLPFNNIQSSKF